MNKLFLIAAVILALPLIAQAQEAPRTEILAGYSYLRLEDNNDGQDRDLNGFNISGNVTVLGKSLGLKADFSGHFGDFVSIPGLPSTDQRQFLFLFGPQYSLRKSERIQPFAHALFGFARTTLDNDAVLGGDNITDTNFAFAVGGGVDLKALSNRLALRLVQADYVLTRVDDPLGTGSTTNNNLRVSTGIVLRLGVVE
jgi:hypothetical protein